ncbi:MAG TPA: DUF4396 domain-containing protein [Gammaproteobacteria bacterium]|nr:DUF4396 domain-containing protein [Gammaproteobacteria bacterium]
MESVPHWLHVIAWLSLAVGSVCTLLIAGDIVDGRRQPMGIMNVVWPITGLYAGPLGLWAYRRIGRAPAQGAATAGRPFWQQVLVSTTHCGAGCTLGDIAGEWTVATSPVLWLASPLATGYAVDFLYAYGFGILFQYLSIVPMRGLGPLEGVKEAVKADTLSLVAWQVGMYGWMAFVQLWLFRPGLHAGQPTFWLMMQLAMLVGFLTSYPANIFLLKAGIKEAM